MSIATLKRKSSRFFYPVSTTHFSLSGTHRNIRQFNNTNLSSLSSSCHLDSDSTGNTVKTTSGLLSGWRNPVCLYSQPNPMFLSDLLSFKTNSPDNTSQSSYINTKRRCVSLNTPHIDVVDSDNNKCGTCISRIGSRIIYQSNIKESSNIKSLTNSSSNYTSNGLGRKECLPNTTSNNILLPNNICG